MNSGFININF